MAPVLRADEEFVRLSVNLKRCSILRNRLSSQSIGPDNIAQVYSILVVPPDSDEVATFFENAQVIYLLGPSYEASSRYDGL